MTAEKSGGDTLRSENRVTRPRGEGDSEGVCDPGYEHGGRIETRPPGGHEVVANEDDETEHEASADGDRHAGGRGNALQPHEARRDHRVASKQCGHEQAVGVRIPDVRPKSGRNEGAHRHRDKSTDDEAGCETREHSQENAFVEHV